MTLRAPDNHRMNRSLSCDFVQSAASRSYSFGSPAIEADTRSVWVLPGYAGAFAVSLLLWRVALDAIGLI